jgi:hypothetical protein
MEYLIGKRGQEIHLSLAVEAAEEETPAIRKLLDSFLKKHATHTVQPVETVANTIFPQSLYLPKLGAGARPHLYEMYGFAHRVGRRHPANQTGTYFDRLVAWPGQKGVLNQLEEMVRRLKHQMQKRSGRFSSIYEIGVWEPEIEIEDVDSDEPLELRTFQPGTDTRLMGFPCLSHVSLKLVGGQLHLSALYRNQHFIRKAYGNLIGLGRLQRFLCSESGATPGELLCLATHADAELNSRDFTRADVEQLVVQCRRLANSVAVAASA